MLLAELLIYEHIVIQCHDAPDADTIASGFALYHYFLNAGKTVHLVYSGKFQISKPNITLMLDLLNIPIVYAEELPPCELLITVDCQYGSGNITKFEAPHIAVIDHHRQCTPQTEYSMICSNYGSCSTVVWSLLRGIGVNVNENLDVSTALYYGLYTDTAHFSEIYHPMDKDMRDALMFRDMKFFDLINTNMTTEELAISARALQRYLYDKEYRAALIPVEPCDPNVLGIISDFMIQVDEIKLCVAFNTNANGCKLSVRSCTVDSRADDLAEFLCKDIGSGGGRRNKAGGFLSQYLFLEQEGNTDYEAYLRREMQRYFHMFRIIHARDFVVDMTQMHRYVKKKTRLGVVHTAEFLREGTPVLVRTLEGDLECVSARNLFIMIGINGEVYPIKREKFQRTYEECDGKPEYYSEYEPTIHNTLTGEAYQLRDYMHTCCARGTSYIYAQKLEECVKVFTQWDEYKYLKGVEGDYLAVREDDLHDVYVIEQHIFLRSYERCQDG